MSRFTVITTDPGSLPDHVREQASVILELLEGKSKESGDYLFVRVVKDDGDFTPPGAPVVHLCIQEEEEET
jgi:hypothetical protein